MIFTNYCGHQDAHVRLFYELFLCDAHEVTRIEHYLAVVSKILKD